MKESAFQRQVIAALRAQGDYVFKVVGSAMQQRGTPDLLVCHNGLFIAPELKVKGKKLSKLQEYESELINAAGGKSGRVETFEDLWRLLE